VQAAILHKNHNGGMDGLPWWTTVFFLPVLALSAAHLWALVDAAMVPKERWRAAGRHKLLWLVLIFYGYVVAAAWYAWRVRPAIRG
jgi:hypothetical protein